MCELVTATRSGTPAQWEATLERDPRLIATMIDVVERATESRRR